MSLRTMERLLIASSLLLGVAATGCDDDDDVPDDMGGMDGGGMTDGGTDARADAKPDTGGGGGDTGPTGETISCGSNTCSGAVIANIDIAPCCVADTNACGLDADDIKRASPSSPFTGCVPKDVPAASASTYCGAFFDQIEPDGDHENGGLDIKSGNRFAVFEGCCLDTGECGANITVPRGADSELNSHLGCVSFARLRDAFDAQGDGGAEEALPDNLPFCNPSNGEPPTEGTVPGVSKFVCGCGEGVVYDADAPGLPCLSNLPPAVCGKDEPKTEELEKIPEFICGCTASSALPCLKNLAASTCGTKAIDADSPELAAVPEFICGCTADSKLPCMQNVEAEVCGGKAITADSTELDSLPVFICGAVGLTTPSALPTMANVEASICGKKAITADSAELAAVPQFICGQTNNPQATVLPTMRNVDVAICGTKVITTDSAELNSIPVFICGAVNNPDTSALPPKLRNVDTAICGKAPVAAGSPFLAGVPKFFCGCTSNNAKELGCLRNVANTVCGAAAPSAQVLGLVPEFVCGCGATTQDAGVLKLCMSFVETTTCGTKNTVVNDRGTPSVPQDDCLEGVPEYAVGCGEEADTGSNPSCLRRAGTFLGCIDIPEQTPALPRVPEYVCGCGNAPTDVAQPFPAYPCLSRVHTTICGAVPISASAQVQGVTNNVCGCGDGVATGTNCVKNVPATICGAIPVCTSCPGGTTCTDTNSDGIGNTCIPD